jgi:hypothetical protein
VGDEDAADAAFHAIGALSGERGKRHKVGVPAWAEAGRGDDREGAESCVEGGDRREVVEDVQVGAGREISCTM